MLLCLGLLQMRLFTISYVWDEVKALPEQSSHEIADEIFKSTRVYAMPASMWELSLTPQI